LAHVLTSEEFDQEYRDMLADSLLGISAQDIAQIIQTAREQVAIIAQSLDIDINTAMKKNRFRKRYPPLKLLNAGSSSYYSRFHQRIQDNQF